MRLTAAGEVMLSFVRRSLSELESATSQVEQLRGLMRGEVRLGCAESVGTDIVPRIVAGWQAVHPGVQFHLQVGGTQSLMAALMQDEVELVVAHDPPPQPQVKLLADMAQPLHVMMRPGHPLASRRSLRLADCQAYPVALGDASFGSRRLLDAHVAQIEIDSCARWSSPARWRPSRHLPAMATRCASSSKPAPGATARWGNW